MSGEKRGGASNRVIVITSRLKRLNDEWTNNGQDPEM